MRNWKRWLPSRKWLIFPPLALGIAAVAYLASSKKPLPREQQKEIAQQLPIQTVRNESLVPTSTGYGTAQAIRNWNAVAEVKGQIESIHENLESGVWMPAKETLVTIDQRDYQLRLRQRRADLAAAKARVDELQASMTADTKSLAIEQDLLELNRTEVNRFERLASTNAISPNDLDQARSVFLKQSQAVQKLENALLLYPAKIDSAKAAVESAQTGVDEAQRDLERTAIKTPFAGVLSGVDLEVGQFVSQNQSLFRVLDTSTVEISAQFSLSQLSRLLSLRREEAIGGNLNPSSAKILDQLTATIITRSADLEITYQGKPVRISESIDPQTRTLGIVIQVNNRPRESESAPSDSSGRPTLRPGTFCEIVLSGREVTGIVTVPSSAIDGNSVFILDEQSRIKRVEVEIGERFGDRIVIQDGLSLGDEVVTKLPVPAVEGLLVQRPANEPQPATYTQDSSSNSGGSQQPASEDPRFRKNPAEMEQLQTNDDGGGAP